MLTIENFMENNGQTVRKFKLLFFYVEKRKRIKCQLKLILVLRSLMELLITKPFKMDSAISPTTEPN